MRGRAPQQATRLTSVTPDAPIPKRHPICDIKPTVDQYLARLSSTFDGVYATGYTPTTGGPPFSRGTC